MYRRTACLQAVRELPSGQAAPLVRFVAESVGGLAAMTDVQQAALAEVRWLHHRMAERVH